MKQTTSITICKVLKEGRCVFIRKNDDILFYYVYTQKVDKSKYAINVVEGTIGGSAIEGFGKIVTLKEAVKTVNELIAERVKIGWKGLSFPQWIDGNIWDKDVHVFSFHGKTKLIDYVKERIF